MWSELGGEAEWGLPSRSDTSKVEKFAILPVGEIRLVSPAKRRLPASRNSLLTCSRGRGCFLHSDIVQRCCPRHANPPARSWFFLLLSTCGGLPPNLPYDRFGTVFVWHDIQSFLWVKFSPGVSLNSCLVFVSHGLTGNNSFQLTLY